MGDVTYTSGRIETYSSSVNDGLAATYTYTYDQNGNITSILYGTGEEIRYYYDDIGQLIREDNTPLGATYVYTYDDAGNRLKKYTYALTAEDVEPSGTPASDSYIYSISNWMDRLTFFNETQITYDAIGNPLSYYNGSSYTFTWNGRCLTGAVKGSSVLSFTYNDEGIRTSKTVNGVTTTYYLNGSQIIGEETGGSLTVYLYDTAGLPLGMQYRASSYADDVWDVYWCRA